MSWKAEVNTYSDSADTWTGNALRFATPEEAKKYGDNLFSRWMAVRHVRVVESPDPANYSWDAVNHRAVTLAEAPPAPVEPNAIKKGTKLRMDDDSLGEMACNKRGIIRSMSIGGEVGSMYVWRISHAQIDGQWRPVKLSASQRFKRRTVEKDLGR